MSENTLADVAQKLTADEATALQSMHKQAQEIVHNIGMAEARKAKMLGQLAEIDEHAQGVMNSVAARLGIPPGTAWQVTPDGSVVMLNNLPKPPEA